MVKEIFFQSSLPRSGSTLLQNILGQRPDFYVTPTSGVLELIFGARTNYTECLEFKAQDSETMKKGFLNFCRAGVFGFFEAITDRPYVVDKSRGWGIHYNFLEAFYHENGGPKIICMVRNPENIFASMEQNYRNTSILHHKFVNQLQMIGTSTLKRFEIWANSQPVGFALERLKDMILQGIHHKICFVRYEDLVSNPKQEMNKIYDYLGIDRFEHDFTKIEQITVEDDQVYGLVSHKIKNILEVSQTDARQILGEEICLLIRQRYQWFYKYFNY